MTQLVQVLSAWYTLSFVLTIVPNVRERFTKTLQTSAKYFGEK